MTQTQRSVPHSERARRGWHSWVPWLFLTLAAAVTATATNVKAFNTSGGSSFARFWRSAFSPDLSPEFIGVVARASGITVAYAVLGTLVALVIGVACAPLVSTRSLDVSVGSSPTRAVLRALRATARSVLAVLRSVHELVWGLLFVQILGLDPWVAVLAIGLPYGAITAKVFAEFLDTTDGRPHRQLRSAGASRFTGAWFGLIPLARRNLVAYSFYRFECAMRAAAILGIIGAGGLGSELRISFETLRYSEVWSLLWALIVLSALADGWSTLVRRHAEPTNRSRVLVGSAVLLAGLVPFSIWWSDLGVARLTSGRTRALAADLASRAWPPVRGNQRWSEVLGDSWDTLAMSVLAMAVALVLSFAAALIAGGALRGHTTLRTDRSPRSVLVAALELLTRFVLLVTRAVPAPMWAFVFVLVLLPGIWPGAIALGVYTFGVLGRLQAEVVETADHRPTRSLRQLGAGAAVSALFGIVPVVAERFRALSFYRWEVTIRDTVVVGVVGAAGLGRTLNQQLAGRAFDQALFTLIVLAVLTICVDLISGRARASSQETGSAPAVP